MTSNGKTICSIFRGCGLIFFFFCNILIANQIKQNCCDAPKKSHKTVNYPFSVRNSISFHLFSCHKMAEIRFCASAMLLTTISFRKLCFPYANGFVRICLKMLCKTVCGWMLPLRGQHCRHRRFHRFVIVVVVVAAVAAVVYLHIIYVDFLYIKINLKPCSCSFLHVYMPANSFIFISFLHLFYAQILFTTIRLFNECACVNVHHLHIFNLIFILFFFFGSFIFHCRHRPRA